MPLALCPLVFGALPLPFCLPGTPAPTLGPTHQRPLTLTLQPWPLFPCPCRFHSTPFPYAPLCHWKLPLENGIRKCTCKMPLENATGKCHCKFALKMQSNVPLQFATGNSHWKIKLENANGNCLRKMPLANTAGNGH